MWGRGQELGTDHFMSRQTTWRDLLWLVPSPPPDWVLSVIGGSGGPSYLCNSGLASPGAQFVSGVGRDHSWRCLQKISRSTDWDSGGSGSVSESPGPDFPAPAPPVLPAPRVPRTPPSPSRGSRPLLPWGCWEDWEGRRLRLTRVESLRVTTWEEKMSKVLRYLQDSPAQGPQPFLPTLPLLSALSMI